MTHIAVGYTCCIDVFGLNSLQYAQAKVLLDVQHGEDGLVLICFGEEHAGVPETGAQLLLRLQLDLNGQPTKQGQLGNFNELK